jgi:peptidyl-prolyl cis-trans isomerase B (cyclophilin B)
MGLTATDRRRNSMRGITRAAGIALAGLVTMATGADSAKAAATTTPASAATKVEFKTNQGVFVVELDAAKAPKTVANFLQYVRDGHYDGTIFHRVIKGFMIQGGGFTADMKQKSTRAPVANEAKNGLKNMRGTVAMARTSDPHSASAQFFVNTVDNDFLNFKAENAQGWGYCVFGRVVSGMDVVDKIENATTGAQDMPTKTMLIEKAAVQK